MNASLLDILLRSEIFNFWPWCLVQKSNQEVIREGIDQKIISPIWYLLLRLSNYKSGNSDAVLVCASAAAAVRSISITFGARTVAHPRSGLIKCTWRRLSRIVEVQKVGFPTWTKKSKETRTIVYSDTFPKPITKWSIVTCTQKKFGLSGNGENLLTCQSGWSPPSHSFPKVWLRVRFNDDK